MGARRTRLLVVFVDRGRPDEEIVHIISAREATT
jgi:uncharacterized DUF497 family protein